MMLNIFGKVYQTNNQINQLEKLSQNYLAVLHCNYDNILMIPSFEQNL